MTEVLLHNSNPLLTFFRGSDSLSIPEPIQQVPLQTTTAAIASVATVATVTVTKGKLMVPQPDSITAR